MNTQIYDCIQSILEENQKFLTQDWDHEYEKAEKDEVFKSIYKNQTQHLNPIEKNRVLNELEKLGPLEQLIENPEITEILVNQHNQVLYEKNGQLTLADDFFFSLQTYHDCIERLCQICGSYINKEKSFIETQIDRLRITIIYGGLARGHHLLSIRKQPLQILSLTDLRKNNWCSDFELQTLKRIIHEKSNFLVVGGTSSGKTTVLQALLGELPENCRTIAIEDTQELRIVNAFSVSLLTRTDYLVRQNSVSMTDLLKRALRLRPDRLVVGEIRGGEATDLLMALSTGHAGSFGSLHAQNHSEALLRLEMLIQMGAPQWTHESIRRLMGLTVKYIIVVKKENEHRHLDGVYKITSVEKTGFSVMKVETEADL